jgi:benzylsuccinate CoA-transferase BbsE subunit
MPNTVLEPYRVLDMTDHKGFLCGRILGDFGADVIKVEPIGGEPSRMIGPFYHDTRDRNKSLCWYAYNANKRSITLSIETAKGVEIFKKLVQTADVVIESFPTGYLDRIGLGYDDLSRIKPRIVMTSITAFGQEGPWRHQQEVDPIAAEEPEQHRDQLSRGR